MHLLTMKNEMDVADVLALTGVSKPTLYRWMEKHPTSVEPSGTSERGKPFPKPVRKDGRTVLWSADEVNGWWRANRRSVGRHPQQKTIVSVPMSAFREAMRAVPEEYEKDGQMVVVDHIAAIRRFEANRDDDEVKLWFDDAFDAAEFMLRFNSL